MKRYPWLVTACVVAAWALLLLQPVTAAPGPPPPKSGGPFDGEWRTSFGTVTLKQTGAAVSGTWGDAGQFTLKGTVNGKTLSFEYEEGQARGDGRWTLDDTGHAFGGQFQVRGGRSGVWLGWRPDPDAARGKPAHFSGLWLTDLGLMELSQEGGRVKGRFALRGGSEIDGTVTGRRLEFTHVGFRPGKGWFDLSPGARVPAATFAGAAVTDGSAGWYGWRGRRAPEFARQAKLVPGKIVDGSTAGLLTYAARAPEGYRPGDARRWPAVVILHGSNMNARAYVNTLAAAWPDIARDYLLIGINGECPSDLGAPAAKAAAAGASARGGTGAPTAREPAFNYTYVNYVGRSTFKGFPGTDRESPALMAEALDDLRAAYGVSRFFVGGHSQGGFLTYSLLMNFPEKIAGAFPVSAGLIFQCEPGAYADADLRAAQRRVPLAIVHGRQDHVVEFGTGEYAATLFGEASWPALKFLADDSGAAHMFGRLPVGPAIRWLEAQSSEDPAALLDFAERSLKAKSHRDAAAALGRARALLESAPAPAPGTSAPAAGAANHALKQRYERLARDLDARAAPGAKEFLPRIQAAQAGAKDADPAAWIDRFLAWRDEFEFAPAAGPAMEAFAALRAAQDPPARTLLDQATAAFRQGQRDQGYAKYQELVTRFPAASSYRNVKRWLAARK